MIVKIFQSSTEGAAVLTTQDKSIRHALVLDDTLRSKMNRRTRAFFNAEVQSDGTVALFNRLSDQKW